jgi:glycosyltransferase involved in cell wall biosynthesis
MAMEVDRLETQRIAFLLDNLRGGGAERVILSIAAGFAARGYVVDLLVCERRGELCDSIPQDVNLVELHADGQLAGLWAALRSSREGVGSVTSCVVSGRKIPRSFRYINAVANYLLEHQPAVMYSVLPKANICAVLAVTSTGIGTRVFIGVQNALSAQSARGRRDGKGKMHFLVPLLRHCYSLAHGFICSSGGVAEDAIRFLDLDATRVSVVYNPVQIPEAASSDGDSPAHPWLRAGAPPVVLGIGRLVEQKNFRLLIRAFALVRQQTDARLIILGGDASSEDQIATGQMLQALAAELHVGDDVDLPGYQPNPHDYLRDARLFVLSSQYEGFGNVLVEALLAGCPIVSTDCPSGPAEILDGGTFGTLVPVDDVDALAAAIGSALTAAPESEILRRRGGEFSQERAVANHQRLFFGEDSS